MHKSIAPTVTDAGFIFKDRRAVLKGSVQVFDRGLRYYATMDPDTWNMIYIKSIKDEMPRGRKAPEPVHVPVLPITK